MALPYNNLHSGTQYYLHKSFQACAVSVRLIPVTA
jgi:hypothetical protein